MRSAFRLEVAGDRLATLTFDLPDKKVNIFDRGVLAELEALLPELAARKDIGCLLLLSGKRGNFIAGADVAEIAGVSDPLEAEAGSRIGQRLFAAWEALPFPTVAAIEATCLGGGTELALASTWRVVADRAEVKIGLPEIRLGILPGWGGCTRLPRLIGIAEALDIILAGKSVIAKKAFRLGLADALLPAAGFLGYARDFALARRDQPRKAGGDTDFRELLLEKNPFGRKVLFDQARKKTLEQTHGQYPAPLRAIEVVRIGIEKGRQAGFDAEARAVGELATGAVAKNLIHVFQLMEAAKKDGHPPGGETAEPHPVAAAAVVGAGVMGGGIAQLIADQTGVPTRLKDIQEGALASGMAHAAALFEKQVSRRRLTPAEARRRLALVRPALDYSGLGRADLVVEAVIEKLEVKQKVFAEMAAAVPEDAILASNTSSLSIDKIGRDTPRPERVVGMHFFNPADKMPLVEVVVGERTGGRAVATIVAFSRRLGKTPILVKDSPGFLVNRLLTFYLAEALWLLDEGHSIADLDRAMTGWGMPLGPIALTDEVGIDVAVKVAHILAEAFAERLPLPTWIDRMTGEGRLGAKTGSGFYAYEGRERRQPDPEAYELLGLHPRASRVEASSFVDRMVLPMVNEAARCLDEQVVADAGSLDLALILGTGFPPFRGGLCRWADGQGLSQITILLERLAESVGERFQPCPALLEVARAGGFYARYPGR